MAHRAIIVGLGKNPRLAQITRVICNLTRQSTSSVQSSLNKLPFEIPNFPEGEDGDILAKTLERLGLKIQVDDLSPNEKGIGSKKEAGVSRKTKTGGAWNLRELLQEDKNRKSSEKVSPPYEQGSQTPRNAEFLDNTSEKQQIEKTSVPQKTGSRSTFAPRSTFVKNKTEYGFSPSTESSKKMDKKILGLVVAAVFLLSLVWFNQGENDENNSASSNQNRFSKVQERRISSKTPTPIQQSKNEKNRLRQLTKVIRNFGVLMEPPDVQEKWVKIRMSIQENIPEKVYERGYFFWRAVDKIYAEKEIQASWHHQDGSLYEISVPDSESPKTKASFRKYIKRIVVGEKLFQPISHPKEPL